MTELDIKHALRNYHKIRTHYQSIVNKIEAIEVQQTKTGGSVVKMPDGHTDNEQRKLGLIERKSKLQRELDIYEYYMSLSTDFINALREPYRSMVRNKYIDKITNDKLVEVYHYSRQSMDKIIKKLIERYIALT